MQTEYDNAVLREMILEAFNFEELDEFAFEYFPEVKKEFFSPALSLSLRIIALIEYCERRNLMTTLVDKVKEVRPIIYKKYKDSLITSQSTALVEFISDSHLKLEELTEKQKEALALAFKIALASVLGVNPGEIVIVDMASGSIKLIFEMPENLIPPLFENHRQIAKETGFSLLIIRLDTGNLTRVLKEQGTLEEKIYSDTGEEIGVLITDSFESFSETNSISEEAPGLLKAISNALKLATSFEFEATTIDSHEVKVENRHRTQGIVTSRAEIDKLLVEIERLKAQIAKALAEEEAEEE